MQIKQETVKSKKKRVKGKHVKQPRRSLYRPECTFRKD